MITRKEYMKNHRELHEKYYTEIGLDVGVNLPSEFIAKVKNALAKGDKHINSIPLKVWDSMATPYLHSWRVYEIFKKRGVDGVALADIVCMLKAMARYYAKKEVK